MQETGKEGKNSTGIYALKILSVGQAIVRTAVSVDSTGLTPIDDKQVSVRFLELYLAILNIIIISKKR